MKKELMPDLEMVACDVCGRTILKGERTEPYLVPDGSRRLVCDLCVRRAEGAGWLRESLYGDLPASAPRAEPRRSLLGRLRRRVEDGLGSHETGAAAPPNGTYDRGAWQDTNEAEGGGVPQGTEDHEAGQGYEASGEHNPAEGYEQVEGYGAGEVYAPGEGHEPAVGEGPAEADGQAAGHGQAEESYYDGDPGAHAGAAEPVEEAPPGEGPHSQVAMPGAAPVEADPRPGYEPAVESAAAAGGLGEDEPYQPAKATRGRLVGEEPVAAPPSGEIERDVVSAPLEEIPPEDPPLEGSLLHEPAPEEFSHDEQAADPRAARRERRQRRRLRDPRHVRAVPTGAEAKVQRALEIFNASPYRRTVGGLVRTLGTPWVTARPDEGSSSEVTVVVAWELSWYQFRVDLSDVDEAVAVADKGHEIDEIDAELRRWNATAADDGALESGMARE